MTTTGTNQGDRQASVRAATGTTWTYEGDWHALFTQAGVASGDFNGRLLAWINTRLGTTYSEINGAMVAFAVNQGFTSWGAMGTFDASGVPAAPVNTVAPAIYGANYYTGTTLTADRGLWTGSPAPAYTYQWKRGGSNISSATNLTYVLVSADEGTTITVTVTATNTQGAASATSAGIAALALPTAPANTVAPTLSSGSANVGTAITCSPGTWTGSPTPTFTYQWFWADTVTAIGGATSSTYTPISGDAGHTLLCNVTGTNSTSPFTASASTSATSAVTTGPAIPAGAIGVWDISSYASASNKTLTNSVAASGPSANILTTPSRLFEDTLLWSVSNATRTDNFATGPDGTAGMATRIVGGAGDWFLVSPSSASPTLSAGTYTFAIDVKSNTGSTQNVRIQLFTSGISTSDTATTSWKTIKVTGTVASGAQTLVPIRGDGTNAGDVLIANARLFAGSSDLGAEVPAGHIYLGVNATNTVPTYASGVLDTSSAVSLGYLQFPTITTTDYTFSALVKKASAGAGFDTMLTKIGAGGVSAFTTFACHADVGGLPQAGCNGTQTFGQTIAPNTGLWDLQTDAGYHQITIRYEASTTSLSLFLDDVQVARQSVSSTTFTLENFWFGAVAGISFASGLKYAGKMGLWTRALTNAEVRDFYKLSRAAAQAQGVTVNPVARYALFEGDSITAGQTGTGWPYLVAGSVTSKLLGTNNAVSGSTLASISARMAFLSDALPPLADRTGRKFIYADMEGTNDLAAYSSEAQFETDKFAFFDGLRTAGWYVIAASPTDRADATFRTRVATWATSLAASVGTHINAYAAVHENANIGASGACTNTTYFNGDQIHLTTTGETVESGIFTPLVDAA